MRGHKRWIVTAALIVAGIRLWMQVRGKTKTPFDEWVVGWGALFMLLAIFSETGPAGEQLAAGLAGTVVLGDVLVNGSSLFEDISGAIKGAEKGQPVLTPSPFAPMTVSSSTPPTRHAVPPAPARPSVHPTGRLAFQQ